MRWPFLESPVSVVLLTVFAYFCVAYIVIFSVQFNKSRSFKCKTDSIWKASSGDKNSGHMHDLSGYFMSF